MENQNIDQVILAYLQEEATTNEIEILRKWLSDDPANQNIFESVKHHWQNSTLSVGASDTDKAYDRIMSKSYMDSYDGLIDINSTKINTPSQQRTLNIPWLKIAAALILFFTLAFSVYFIINSNQISQEIVIAKVIIKQNPKGQKLTTYLPDGSKVILNSLSEIRYKSPFVGNERVIELKGEAFFEVKKNVYRPFKVISKGITTTALGTSFNVNGKNDNHVEVALVTGKVRVVDASLNTVILDPGKSAIAGLEGEIKVQEFNYLDKAGWKDGVLAFKENSLTMIFSKLEDWYGVRFEVDEANFGQYHYSGNYKNKTLDEVLQGISFVHEFNYKITEDTVKIIFK